MKEGKLPDFPATTFLFGGKAAPGYVNAKLIIKFINNIAQTINADASIDGKIKIFFLPNYRVTMAEKIIPASDLSEQISTAGFEASGTGNMKFMCNGALTIGTMDGATVEMAEEVGQENMFIFGHSADEVERMRPGYDPYAWILRDSEIHKVVDLVLSGYFNVLEPNVFEPLRQALLDQNDKYFLFADLRSYANTHQEATFLYASNPDEWARRAILNIAKSGKFSSDRTIMEYASDIWKVKRCPMDRDESSSSTMRAARKR